MFCLYLLCSYYDFKEDACDLSTIFFQGCFTSIGTRGQLKNFHVACEGILLDMGKSYRHKIITKHNNEWTVCIILGGIVCRYIMWTMQCGDVMTNKLFRVIYPPQCISNPKDLMTWVSDPTLRLTSDFEFVLWAQIKHDYHKISNVRRTKSQIWNVSCLVLQLALPNPLKPDVESIIKM